MTTPMQRVIQLVKEECEIWQQECIQAERRIEEMKEENARLREQLSNCICKVRM